MNSPSFIINWGPGLHKRTHSVVWVKLVQWFWKRRLLINLVNAFSQLCYYLPLEKDVNFHLIKIELMCFIFGCYCPSGSGWENFKIWSLTISLLSPLGNDIHVYLHIRSDRNFIWNSLENYILCKIHEIFPNEFHFYSVSLKFLKWISHAEILSVCVIFCRIYHTGSSYNQNLYAVYIINI